MSVPVPIECLPFGRRALIRTDTFEGQHFQSGQCSIAWYAPGVADDDMLLANCTGIRSIPHRRFRRGGHGDPGVEAQA